MTSFLPEPLVSAYRPVPDSFDEMVSDGRIDNRLELFADPNHDHGQAAIPVFLPELRFQACKLTLARTTPGCEKVDQDRSTTF